MADKTSIEWTATRHPDGTVTPGATWNPIRGTTFDRWMCQKISPGCDHCYASTFNQRWGGMEYPPEGSLNSTAWRLDEATLSQPLRWRRPRVIFVCSMTDLFGSWVSLDWLDQIWGVMAAAHWHTFQVLTKRPSRMRDYLTERLRVRGVPVMVRTGVNGRGPLRLEWTRAEPTLPLPNVWLGTSIELDRYGWRAVALREIPATVRFISAEPLLGPLHSLDLTGIDWLITGGESGPKHRPIEVGWVRDLRNRCQAHETAFFHKQWGGRTPKAGGRLLDGREWNEMPETRAAVLV